ncbi:peptidoglycan DD-metalloendopeptidase family protein [Parathalassolituus penaei]|uniref:Peptidoglycan DD-metalloendopeptidase family protein n=1 Tax=Parathalassolituus penaei TaxID=2997323 RepID=A0A9X3EE89_9GAMM|nr:peptidoglycan DD-metalloendopeptidase family protein [Parathalassolituus penaei]MCY0965580.1 peptidoglycan DD-metalloendopeptidase family protein [Parathalassolituus penaei]
MNALYAVTLVTIVSLTTACSTGGNFVSVEKKFPSNERSASRNSGSAGNSADYYIVQKGDTLYSIAFRYGMNHLQLAASNGIYSPYTIYPGQKIDVRNGSSRSQTVATSTATSTTYAVPQTTPVTVSKPTPIVSNPVVVTRPIAVDSPAAPVDPAPVSNGKWNWPSNGAILARFSTNEPVNKGIDLAGTMGEPVKAAAAGTVVYAGEGLRGYGNLVIIKHDDTFLSAYAHASRILVQEKDSIKAGQTIAETGSTGTDRVKLHFEIRKNGNPVDPLLYLPKR